MKQRAVAIIGLACRLPGADSVDAFWRNLCDGVESIRFFTDEELLAAGVPAASLRDPAYVKASPTITDIEMFDASFFEYSPREATLMDPAHRLLLQVAWEAFEDAGQVPGQSEEPVAVFAGTGGIVSTYLIGRMPFTTELPDYTGTLAHIGNDKDFPATRISHKFDLTGPSINVQTACSTALVAVHLACQSILSGESGMALAGAASVRVPHIAGHVGLKGGILSLDGHVRAFDAAASGTMFGSGVGAVLLKELDRAIADGDNIYAVIRGSAVNNDGADKVSYTAPSAAAQARAMVEALTLADIAPERVGYIECHGTGTAVGDPIEIDALTRAFRTGTDRTGFCAVGSVKANIGHLEQTAGVASLIKAALVLKRGKIPPQINLSVPNPKIDFAASPFTVSTKLRDFPRGDVPRIAAVNALGVGGTNAFLVLEEAPQAPAPAVGTGPCLFTLSARSQATLETAIAQHHEWLTGNSHASLAGICATRATRRTHFAYRLALVADDTAALAAALADAPPALPIPAQRRIAFLFSGQGSQYAGMGADLYAREPVFRAVLDQCDAALRGVLDPPLLDVMFDRVGQGALINETAYTQPALFALQVALAALWRSWGVTPDSVIGHSVGEFAAAVIAGSLALEDALRLIAARGQAMQALPQDGAMAAIFDDADSVAAAIATWPGKIAIAAINGPHNTTISGAREAVDAVATIFSERGIRVQKLTVSHAFHSPLMTPALPALRAAAKVSGQAPSIPWISTLTGTEIVAPPDAAYWCDHALQPVRFLAAIHALEQLGATDFIEIGPGSTLLALGRQACEGDGFAWLASLSRRGERQELLGSLGQLYVRGQTIDWKAVQAPHPAPFVSLPSYPFERRRFWLDDNRTQYAPPAFEEGPAGARLRSALPEAQFETTLGLARQPWLNDHRIHGAPVLPTTVGLTMLADAARRFFSADAVTVANLQYREALILPDAGDCVVQTILAPLGEGRAECRIASQGPDGSWRTHIVGMVSTDTVEPERADLTRVAGRCPERLAPEQYYDAIAPLGLNYGPLFRGITAIRRGEGELLTQVVLPDGLDADGLHPALLDACLHIYPLLAEDDPELAELGDAGPVYLPVSVGRFWATAPTGRTVTVVARRREADDTETLLVDIALHDEAGTAIAMIEGLALKRLDPALFSPARRDIYYQLVWRPAPALTPGEVPPHEEWLLLADRGGVAENLAAALTEAGIACTIATDDTIPQTATRVIHLRGLDADRVDETTQRHSIGSALAAIQALGAARDTSQARLWIVTRHAVAVTDWENTEPAQAPLWGFGRSAALELPHVWGGMVDTDETTDGDALVREILAGVEQQVALRGGSRHVARLIRAEPPKPARTLDPDGLHLITGGLGALGVELARFLVSKRGARHLLLASRRGSADPAAESARAELEALGATVRIEAADATDEAALTHLIDTAEAGPLPLKSVFHAAGLLDDGIVAGMGWEKFWRVLAPKLIGGQILHERTKYLPLDEFVLFSSVLSLLGSAGQSNYTAANAYLDALATQRRAEGLPVLAMNWGPWAESGLATASGERGERIWRARGTHYIPRETGLMAMDALIGGLLSHAAITLTDWPVFLAQFPAPPPFYAELAPPPAPTQAADIRAKLDTAPPSDHPALLAGFIADQARTTLALSEALDHERPLREYGLDSLMAVTLVNRLEAALKVKIATASLIAGPSVGSLAAQILATLDPDATAAPEPAAGATGRDTGTWTVRPMVRPDARMRLFCFPFVGGGSAIYQSWPQRLDPAIELVAIEPPGRLGRIAEPPVSDMDAFVDALMPELQPLLDRPFAFFGHCLGGITMYETARRLIGSSNHRPLHIFASGARPPDALADNGPFEQRLAEDMRALGEYRFDLPAHLQPDAVFADIVRHFDMAATDQFLDDPELRRLMLPVVRAEFQMTANYIHVPENPWDIPITCFANRADIYVARHHALGWGRFTNTRFQVHIRDSGHYSIVEDAKFIQNAINRELMDP